MKSLFMGKFIGGCRVLSTQRNLADLERGFSSNSWSVGLSNWDTNINDGGINLSVGDNRSGVVWFAGCQSRLMEDVPKSFGGVAQFCKYSLHILSSVG